MVPETPSPRLPRMRRRNDDDFEGFVTTHGPRLRAALVARLGLLDGTEAAAEAVVYAWRNWEKVRSLEYPVAYLVKVGASRQLSSDDRRTIPTDPEVLNAIGPPVHVEVHLFGDLEAALDQLTVNQRTCVVLIRGFGWTHAEVAALLGIAVTTVQNHLERAITRLRALL